MPHPSFGRTLSAVVAGVLLCATIGPSDLRAAAPSQAIEQAQHDAEAAVAALQRGDFAAAIPLLDKALAAPNNPTDFKTGLLSYRATAKFNLGQTDGALKDFQAVLALDPQAVDALSNMGLIYQEQGKFDLALTNHRKALDASKKKEPSPETVGVYNNLAWMLATCPEARLRNGAEAVASAEAAIGLLSKSFSDAPPEYVAAAYDTLAAAHAEAGHFPDAITAAEKAMVLMGSAPADRKAGLKAHLDSFKARKPWRSAK
jgi:tetratricopeptide (TPR) repeat protein